MLHDGWGRTINIGFVGEESVVSPSEFAEKNWGCAMRDTSMHKARFWTVAIAVAIASLSAGQVKAQDQLWTGSVSDNVNTAGNWVGGNPQLGSFNPIVFGSNVVGGTMQLQPWITIGGLAVTSDCTTPITINGEYFLFGNGAPISLAAAGSDLTVNPAWLQGWGDINFDVGAGRTLTMNGALGEASDPWWAHNAALVKNGAGTAVLNSANNIYSGNTTVNSGTLQVAGAGLLAGGFYTGAIGIGTGANLQFSGTGVQLLYGVVSGAGSLTKDTSGGGVLYLSGSNTYSGASSVSAGILKFANVAATGSTSGITVNGGGSVAFDVGAAGGTVAAPINLSGDGGGGNGALNTYTPGGQMTFSGPVTMAGGAMVRADGNNSTINFTNAVSGTGTLVFAGFTGGGGTKSSMVLSGSSDFTGALSVTPWYGNTQVTLSGGDNRLPTTALVAVHGDGGLQGALDLNGNNQMIGGLSDSQGWGGNAGTRTVVNTSGTPVTLTLNTTSNQSSGVSIGGTDINGTVGNNLSLVKMGSATQTLSGSSSYTGATTITGGKLAVNGSLGSTAVSVGSGGTLGGSGSIAGAVSVDGILSPGNSPGVITLGSLLLGGSSTTLIEIAGTSRGTSYDGINITDSNGLTYGGILSLNFSSLGSPVADNTTFDIFSFLGSSSGNFSSVSSTGLYAGTWTSKGSGNFELVSGAQTLTFSQSAGDIVVVPEPTSLALLGVGLTMGVAIHRRRRRNSPTAR